MRHWGFCLILITVVKKSRDYGPRGKSLLYYIPHIPHIPHIPDIPHIPHIADIPRIPDIPHIPDIPEIFDLGISSQTGFFLGGVFGTFFWVGFLTQHGPEPPSPILLVGTDATDPKYMYLGRNQTS